MKNISCFEIDVEGCIGFCGSVKEGQYSFVIIVPIDAMLYECTQIIADSFFTALIEDNSSS